MADTFKVLAQTIPAAITLTDSYTVPGATSATISSFLACNQGSVAANFRVSVAVAGAADATKQYLYYDYSIPKKQTYAGTLGITLATTDVIRVYSDTGNVSFNIFGVEIT